MTNWNEVSCRECRQCNRKGLPRSITKGSAFCQKRRGMFTPERTNKWQMFKLNLKDFFVQKGFLRRAGAPKKKKEDEDEEEDE